MLLLAYPRDLSDRLGVRQIRDVEHHGAEIGVGAALTELHRQNDVVAAVPLEILDVLAPGADVEVLVLDAPAVDDLRARGIVKIDDVHAHLAFGAENLAGHVSVGALQLLFDLDVRDAERRTQRKVRNHLDVVAASLVGSPLLGRCRSPVCA